MIAPRSSQSLFRPPSQYVGRVLRRDGFHRAADPAVDPDFDYTRANKL
jgi:hypothetical protein